jgi:hypothetical protein
MRRSSSSPRRPALLSATLGKITSKGLAAERGGWWEGEAEAGAVKRDGPRTVSKVGHYV